MWSIIQVKKISQKIVTTVIISILMISSVAVINIEDSRKSDSDISSNILEDSYEIKPCKINSVISQGEEWIAFDGSTPGSPAEAHVTISDTSGITIVADFHGFWRENNSVEGIEYDSLIMPGATSMQIPGTPNLPCLNEYIEIPYDVSASIEILSSSNDSTSGYNVTPAAPYNLPYMGNENSNSTISDIGSLFFFDGIYSNDTYFPGNLTSTEGSTNETSMIIRGRRLLGICFYPVHLNPVDGTLLVYSQIVIKVKYSSPAQIKSIPERLRSNAFEKIISRTILNYQPCELMYFPIVGLGNSLFAPIIVGYEYLIITTARFKDQANRLADWKNRKGVSTFVWEVDTGSREDVKRAVESVYNSWNPAPTYVLLLGDVEDIPANYDMKLLREVSYGGNSGFVSELDIPNIASDLGYFNIEGNSFLPDFIYGRLSVDTVEQAEIVINKTLEYQQTPPFNQTFYHNILSTGYFNDVDPRNGVEDLGAPFIYTLEVIRKYLERNFGFNVHINYSAAWAEGAYKKEPRSFRRSIDLSFKVSDSLPPNHVWLGGYTDQTYLDHGRGNITANINNGRFLVLCYGHGGSKNMIYPFDVSYPTNGHDRQDRDVVEGLVSPFFNTSYFEDLTNGNMTPFVVMMACNTGWYDGEVDESVLELTTLGVPNPFEDYENECFAENLTRLDEGGAIAVIASSRPAFAGIARHLMNGITQAFWPGFLDSINQPILEIGASLIFGKLNMMRQWPGPITGWDFAVNLLLGNVEPKRTTFEEYQLFGDPELQLWTNVPSNFSVSYPRSVGTTSPQRFVVTVRNKDTGALVNHAKVCIQQEASYPYASTFQVGYTNGRGQVTFDITPAAVPSHVNVTVTKHNFRPHIGSMTVVNTNARIALPNDYQTDGEEFRIEFVNFPSDEPFELHIDEHLVISLPEGINEYRWIMPEGSSKFMNVWAKSGFEDYVSVERIGRISTAEGPDPYIYTQFDSTTWGTDETFSWDNPDITVSENVVTVNVHNAGVDTSVSTDVTLSYSPHLGSLTWHIVDTKPTPRVDGPVFFDVSPITQSHILRVDLYHEQENVIKMGNNIGYDISGIIEMYSPGKGNFLVGNPSCSRKYITVSVKQLGNHTNYWNASLQDYSSQALNPGMTEDVTLFIDSLGEKGSRLFEVEIFTDCMHVCGMIFNASKVNPPLWPPLEPMILLGIGIGIGISVTIVILVKCGTFVMSRRKPD